MRNLETSFQIVTTQQRLELAGRKIREPAFRQNKGLGNEVGYYIFDYPAQDELLVRDWIRDMQRKNSPALDGCALTVFDLYDTLMELLEEEDALEDFFSLERRGGMDAVAREMHCWLFEEDAFLVNRIKERTPEHAVVFLTGVGKCYPALRSHNVLNNLHQVLDHVPVVMFFPGIYSGQELMLFGSVKDNNYYRAFRLTE